MNKNNEIAKAKDLAGGTMTGLAKVLGISRTHCHRMYRLGYLSRDCALTAKAAFPDLDVQSLITPPNRSSAA